jgi:hypothetical protein
VDPDANLAVMAFDPGGTTGWCATSFRLGHLPLFRQYGLEALTREIVSLTSGQLDGAEDRQVNAAIKLINAGIDQENADHVILLYEDFILRRFRQDRDLLAPVRVTAKLEFANNMLWGFPEVKQQASLAKTAMPDKRLKQYKLYRPGEPHANDAIRHNITLIRRLAIKPIWLRKLLNSAGS